MYYNTTGGIGKIKVSLNERGRGEIKFEKFILISKLDTTSVNTCGGRESRSGWRNLTLRTRDSNVWAMTKIPRGRCVCVRTST